MCFTLCLSLISSSGANLNRWVRMVLNRNVCPPIFKKSAEIQNLVFSPFLFFCVRKYNRASRIHSIEKVVYLNFHLISFKLSILVPYFKLDWPSLTPFHKS